MRPRSLSLKAYKGPLEEMGAAVCLTSPALCVITFDTVPSEQEADSARTISSGSLHLSSTNADHLERQTSMGLTRIWLH